ncbi:MAG: hypothetical protein A2151_01070 [Candidatus Muproteobacteria bacterium RBG_16_65_34]|uniref:Uncharacterized protein n=1 Tax=Candidatus Muproteobacteria bacterium RBG_16_65_34 TaxID=1817760 RepID=A0A1F6TUL7_9PROT|nr:MAG: hypothetical protein A2151_01070 [Candidatus Muproteobacteria bacterium RBG_16_65_34]
MMKRGIDLLWLTLFAAAMALTEAAIVIYLRALYYPENPLAIFPLRLLDEAHLGLELAREAATMVMLLAVAWLSQAGFMRRFAAFLVLFGTWDIFYYVWLKLILGWPVEWLEWDVLFLIPWPWVGPWIAPVAIAVLFAAWGGFALASGRGYRADLSAAAWFCVGAALALGAFLAPAMPLIPKGAEAFRGWTPEGFPWALYAGGVLLMGVGLLLALRRPRA